MVLEDFRLETMVHKWKVDTEDGSQSANVRRHDGVCNIGDLHDSYSMPTGVEAEKKSSLWRKSESSAGSPQKGIGAWLLILGKR